ncbi:MAG: hypothetical protein ABIT10_02820 [Alteraurantiacibacter sp.]
MRRTVSAALTASLLTIATPALAQDQPATAPAEDGRIVFEPDQISPEIAGWNFIGTGTTQQAVNPPPACTSDSDIIQAQAAGPQRYDDNGAPIRTSAAVCSVD